MKASFLPQVDTCVKMTFEGVMCVRTNTANGKEWLGMQNGEIFSYPEEMLLDFPVYNIAKTIDQIKPGDIIKSTSSTYSVVEEVKDGKIYSVTFGGNVRKNTPITDFFTRTKTVRVVVNPFGMFNTNQTANNMLPLLMMMDKEGTKSDLADILMFSTMQSGQGSANPFGNLMNSPFAMMTLLGKKGDSSMKDILFLQMMSGNNNMFQTQPVTTAAPKKVEVVEEVVEETTAGKVTE
jgi:hypothetical protein